MSARDFQIAPKETVIRDETPDPESSATREVEERWKAEEYRQGHRFRNVAFCGGVVILLAITIGWAYLVFFCWPSPWDGQAGAMLLAFKTSATTVVLLTLFVSLMRFAIRCFGHHNQQETKADGDGVAIDALRKAIEEAAKKLTASS